MKISENLGRILLERSEREGKQEKVRQLLRRNEKKGGALYIATRTMQWL